LLHEKATLPSIARAALRRDLTQDELHVEGVFDINSILDKPVLVDVVERKSAAGYTYARIAGRDVKRLPTRMSAEPLESPIFVVGYPPSPTGFASLTTWEQKKITESVGWAGPVG
jgi:hypothetical protein